MNEYDSNRILDVTKNKLLSNENLGEANCYILNTCHIREKLQIVYHDIGRVKRV